MVVENLFRKVKSPRLAGFIVWVPMVAGDSSAAAESQRRRLSDEPRLSGVWDPDRTIGRILSPTLGIATRVAWDVYLVYGPDALWRGADPPAPATWMHQLDAEDPARRLDAAVLAEQVERLLPPGAGR